VTVEGGWHREKGVIRFLCRDDVQHKRGRLDRGRGMVAER
jgi:hypothetical protein